jgi:hypothetical protein
MTSNDTTTTAEERLVDFIRSHPAIPYGKIATTLGVSRDYIARLAIKHRISRITTLTDEAVDRLAALVGDKDGE